MRLDRALLDQEVALREPSLVGDLGDRDEDAPGTPANRSTRCKAATRSTGSSDTAADGGSGTAAEPTGCRALPSSDVALTTPTIDDVRDARERIAPHLRPTPLYGYAALDDVVGAEVLVKHENHQPVGAFKVRGGVNLVSQLTDDERARGVICASTGNHGQSIAFAARRFGVPATICVPEQRERSEGRVDGGPRRDARPSRTGLRRCARALRAPRSRARVPLRPQWRRAAADRRRGHAHARDPRGAARRRRGDRPDRRRQRRGGRLHRRRRPRARCPRDRRAVRGGADGVSLVAGAHPARGHDGDDRGGARDPHGVRAAAADHVGVAARVRARPRRGDPRRPGAHDPRRRGTSSSLPAQPPSPRRSACARSSPGSASP